MEPRTTPAHKGNSSFQDEILLKLKNLRLKRGLSQPKVAEILDVTNGRIGNIESSNQPHKYTLAQISRLCSEYGVSISELFTGDKDCTKDELIAAIVRYESEK